MPGLRRLLFALTAAALCLAAPAARAAITVFPDSMAATGASATRAALTCEARDCSANSWVTGTNPDVNSIYLRIRAVHPAIEGNAYNDAVGGEKMSDLDDQFEVVIEQRVQLVVVDMGGNDVCRQSEGSVTSPESFRADFEAAMARLLERRPNTRIAVVSIPSTFHLWDILHTDARAVETWNRNSTCQSMLANPTSTARADVERRARVNERQVELNAILGLVCARYANCRYDGGAAFEFAFEPADVGRDYFHPSLQGQASAAAAMWELPWEF
jgi:lysophospholipase L1-like esterase